MISSSSSASSSSDAVNNPLGIQEKPFSTGKKRHISEVSQEEDPLAESLAKINKISALWQKQTEFEKILALRKLNSKQNAKNSLIFLPKKPNEGEIKELQEELLIDIQKVQEQTLRNKQLLQVLYNALNEQKTDYALEIIDMLNQETQQFTLNDMVQNPAVAFDLIEPVILNKLLTNIDLNSLNGNALEKITRQAFVFNDDELFDKLTSLTVDSLGTFLNPLLDTNAWLAGEIPLRRFASLIGKLLESEPSQKTEALLLQTAIRVLEGLSWQQCMDNTATRTMVLRETISSQLMENVDTNIEYLKILFLSHPNWRSHFNEKLGLLLVEVYYSVTLNIDLNLKKVSFIQSLCNLSIETLVNSGLNIPMMALLDAKNSQANREFINFVHSSKFDAEKSFDLFCKDLPMVFVPNKRKELIVKFFSYYEKRKVNFNKIIDGNSLFFNFFNSLCVTKSFIGQKASVVSALIYKFKIKLTMDNDFNRFPNRENLSPLMLAATCCDIDLVKSLLPGYRNTLFAKDSNNLNVIEYFKKFTSKEVGNNQIQLIRLIDLTVAEKKHFLVEAALNESSTLDLFDLWKEIPFNTLEAAPGISLLLMACKKNSERQLSKERLNNLIILLVAHVPKKDFLVKDPNSIGFLTASLMYYQPHTLINHLHRVLSWDLRVHISDLVGPYLYLQQLGWQFPFSKICDDFPQVVDTAHMQAIFAEICNRHKDFFTQPIYMLNQAHFANVFPESFSSEELKIIKAQSMSEEYENLKKTISAPTLDRLKVVVEQADQLLGYIREKKPSIVALPYDEQERNQFYDNLAEEVKKVIYRSKGNEDLAITFLHNMSEVSGLCATAWQHMIAQRQRELESFPLDFKQQHLKKLMLERVKFVYDFARKNVAAVGFSNEVHLASAILLEYQDKYGFPKDKWRFEKVYKLTDQMKNQFEIRFLSHWGPRFLSQFGEQILNEKEINNVGVFDQTVAAEWMKDNLCGDWMEKEYSVFLPKKDVWEEVYKIVTDYRAATQKPFINYELFEDGMPVFSIPIPPPLLPSNGPDPMDCDDEGENKDKMESLETLKNSIWNCFNTHFRKVSPGTYMDLMSDDDNDDEDGLCLSQTKVFKDAVHHLIQESYPKDQIVPHLLMNNLRNCMRDLVHAERRKMYKTSMVYKPQTASIMPQRFTEMFEAMGYIKRFL